jgi:hypothetical protein
MKSYILVGAVALFAILLTMVPAVATTSLLTAMGTVTDERSNPVQLRSVQKITF